jgi:hypothetical protein
LNTAASSTARSRDSGAEVRSVQHVASGSMIGSSNFDTHLY